MVVVLEKIRDVRDGLLDEVSELGCNVFSAPNWTDMFEHMFYLAQRVLARHFYTLRKQKGYRLSINSGSGGGWP
jgi:hypothetical protein